MADVLNKIDDLPLVYVRHKMDANQELFEKWISEGLVVLHYEEDLAKGNKLSTDPEHYSGSGRKVMQRLWDFCRSGAIVAANYDDYGIRNLILGQLPPGSMIEPLVEPYEDYEEGVAYYKVVKLEGPVRLGYANPTVRPLIVLQPRAGTVVRWRIGNIEKYVKHLYKSILLGRQASSQYPLRDYPFTDYQWEVLCSEYLRREAPSELRIDYLLTPVGRTMKDVDIDGASSSTHVYGQVSLSKNLREVDKKIWLLKSVAQGTGDLDMKKKLVLVYFGPEECRYYFESKYNDVYFIATEEVLESMKGIRILEDMLPFQ